MSLLARALPLLCLSLAGCLTEAAAQGRVAPPNPAVPRSPQHVFNRSPGSWAPTCVATQGCAAPTPLPRCAPGLATRTFAQAIEQRLTLSGQRVSVRAAVRPSGGCTEMACGSRNGVQDCCNSCGGEGLALHGTANSGLDSLALRNGSAAAFPCPGDDSGLCCTVSVPSSGEVVATGTLRPQPGTHGLFFLDAPTLCVP